MHTIYKCICGAYVIGMDVFACMYCVNIQIEMNDRRRGGKERVSHIDPGKSDVNWVNRPAAGRVYARAHTNAPTHRDMEPMVARHVTYTDLSWKRDFYSIHPCFMHNSWLIMSVSQHINTFQDVAAEVHIKLTTHTISTASDARCRTARMHDVFNWVPV